MRAIVVEEFGGPEKLCRREVAMPTIGAGEALVRVKACGVCYLDTIARSGLRPKAKLPLIVGHEVAGEVVEVGTGVCSVVSGDRVASTYRFTCGQCRYCRAAHESLCSNTQGIGVDRDGGYAEYVAIPERSLSKIPDGVSFAQACVCGCVLGAPLKAVICQARVKPGESVLVTGAGGGIGIHALQAAKLCGGRVIAVTSSETKVDRIREAGADHVILSQTLDFWREVLQATDGRGVEVVLEGVGSATFRSSFRSLAPGGRLVFLGELSGDAVQFNPAIVMYREIEISAAQSATAGELEQALTLVQQGFITPVISQTCPLEEAAAVHELLRHKQTFGRVVLTV